jgi:hypothetical protein
MSRKPTQPQRIDWPALIQRMAVAVRGLRGDSLETIEADHQREVQRAEKLRAAIANAEEWVKRNVGED